MVRSTASRILPLPLSLLQMPRLPAETDAEATVVQTAGAVATQTVVQGVTTRNNFI